LKDIYIFLSPPLKILTTKPGEHHMKPFLQNHPYDKTFPVRIGKGHTADQSVLGYIFLAIVVIPGIVAYTIFKISVGDSIKLYTLTAVVVVVLALLYLLLYRYIAGKNIREQKKYNRLAGLNWLDDEKRRALQMRAPIESFDGRWMESLEYHPCEMRLGKRVKFDTFTLGTKTELLEALDESWGILSEKGYNDMVQDLLAGMHSKEYLIFLKTKSVQEKARLTQRLSELTQIPVSYIEACEGTNNNIPSRLLWGFDLIRVIEISRTSFMAGLISEELAWKNILLSASYIRALFTDMEDFFNNYRLGNAFWSNSFEITRQKYEMYQVYVSECNWPIKSLPWVKNAIDILPEFIKTGLTQMVEQEIVKSKPAVVGFRTPNNN
jgi:hypothetical protein